MQIGHILDSEIKAKLGVLSGGKGKVHSKKEKRNKAYSERLSEREVKELMGMFEPTFKKRRGVWRSK